MQIKELDISGAFEITTDVHHDNRGSFHEWFRADKLLVETGYHFDLKQANLSVSKAGVLRGIHFSNSLIGQAKYVTVADGSILDFVVDLRRDSPNFGKWTQVELSEERSNALFIKEGLGHAFLTLSSSATVVYFTSDIYRPEHDMTINALDPKINLDLSAFPGEIIQSERDAKAGSLEDAGSTGLLPEVSVYSDILSGQPGME